MIEFRVASRNDRDAILALRQRCFPDVDIEKQSRAFSEWEFERSPGGEASIMIAMEGDRCLSHVAFLPQSGHFRGAALRAALAVDAMTDPSARGRGLYSKVLQAMLAHTWTKFDLLFAYQNRRNVLGAMLGNGWQVAGRYPVVVRPLSVKGFIREGTDPLLRVHDSSVRLLGAGDAAAMSECAARMTQGDPASLPRSEEWVGWRFFQRPGTTYRVTGVGSSEHLSAWLVTRRVALRGVDSLAIVDLVFSDETDARSLIDDALTVASSDSVGIAAAFASPSHRLHSLLRRKLFLPSPHRFRQLVQSFGDTDAAAVAAWPVSWADTDHL
jgi:hypothetical protein